MLIVGIGGGVTRPRWPSPCAWAPRSTSRRATRPSARRAVEAGAVGAYDSEADWPVPADVVVESVGPATWDRSIRALRPGGRLVVCGGTSGQKVELDLPRLFFKQIEIIGSTMGWYGEFAEVTRLVEQGLPIPVDAVFDSSRLPDGARAPRAAASSSARSSCATRPDPFCRFHARDVARVRSAQNDGRRGRR